MAKAKKSVKSDKLGMEYLVNAMHEATGCTKTKAHAGVQALVAAVTKGVKGGHAVNIAGLGIFRPVRRKARSVKVIGSSRKVNVPAHNSVSCKVSAKLKRAK